MSEEEDECAVKSCRNSRAGNVDINFFEFPQNSERCQEWLNTIKRKDLTVEQAHSHLICQDHFAEEMFVDNKNKCLQPLAFPEEEYEYKIPIGGIKLNKENWPYIEDDDELDDLDNALVLIDDSDQESDDADLDEADEAVAGMREQAAHSDAFYNRKIKNYFKQNFAPNQRRKFDQQLAISKTLERHSVKLVELGVKLYIGNSQLYTFIQKNMFTTLPRPFDLYQHIKKWPLLSGANEFLYKMQRMKLCQFSENEKNCFLLAAEFNLFRCLIYDIKNDRFEGFHDGGDRKTYNIADTAIVLMAKGISSNWKQCLGYIVVDKKDCKTADLVKAFIYKTIINLKLLGIRTHGFIGDVTDLLVQFSTNINISVNNNKFTVCNDEIYFMFDPISLVIDMRNSLVQHDFLLGEEQGNSPITWEMFLTMKKVIEEKNLPVKNTLTKEHFDVDHFDSPLKDHLAEDIFSIKLSMLMISLASKNLVPDHYSQSAALGITIERAVKVLDKFMYKGVNRDSDKYSRIFLKELSATMKNLTVTNRNHEDVTKSTRFRIGWRITVASVIQLMSKFVGATNLNFETTRKDFCPSFAKFRVLTTASAMFYRPTAFQIRRAVKGEIASTYLMECDWKIISKDIDFLSVLTMITDFNFHEKTPLEEMIHKLTPAKLEISDKDNCIVIKIDDVLLQYNNKEKYKGKIFKQLCTFLHTVGTKQHFNAIGRRCDECVMDFKGESEMQKNFMDFIDKLDQQFVNEFPSYAALVDSGRRLLAHVDLVDADNIKCPEFPMKFIRRLFLRARISITMKAINTVLLKNNYTGDFSEFKLEKLSSFAEK